MFFMNTKNSVAWIQLTAGQGPKECGWVVAQLLPIFIRNAENQKLSTKIIEAIAYDKILRKQDLITPDSYLSVLLRLEGSNPSSFLRQWIGLIKWHGESVYRPKHKRVNWMVAIQEFNNREFNTVDLNDLKRDVQFQAIKSSGPGGQHVNKTNSAVHALHLPSGYQVKVSNERSLHKNKQIALERICLHLQGQESVEQKNAKKDRWQMHQDIRRDKPVQIYSGLDFKRIF